MRVIGIICALMLLALPATAKPSDCNSHGQHLSPEKSNALTFQPNATISMSSGDLQVCKGDKMFLSAVSCRVAGGDANGGFDIGQLGAAVRWFDSSNKLVGVMPLPLNGPTDVELLPSQLFYTGAWTSSRPTRFRASPWTTGSPKSST